jgi:hypothetical protein
MTVCTYIRPFASLGLLYAFWAYIGNANVFVGVKNNKLEKHVNKINDNFVFLKNLFILFF